MIKATNKFNYTKYYASLCKSKNQTKPKQNTHTHKKNPKNKSTRQKTHNKTQYIESLKVVGQYNNINM